MIHYLALSVVLAAVWVLWSGHPTPLLLSLGAASCLGVMALLSRMRIVDGQSAPIPLALRAPLFLPWLFLEIAKSNVDVALLILSPKLSISPRLIRVKAGQRTDNGLVIYANSITLTPGTVSISLEGDVIVVHALTADAAHGIETGVMDRMVCRFEGRS